MIWALGLPAAVVPQDGAATPWTDALDSVRQGSPVQAMGLPEGWSATLVGVELGRPDLIDLSVLASCVETEEHPFRDRAHRIVAARSRTATQAWSRLKPEDLSAETLEMLRRRHLQEGIDPRPVAQALLMRRPASIPARELADRIGLEGLAGLFSLKARVERAEALMDAHDNTRARTEARWWLTRSEPDPAQRCRLAYVVGRSSRKLRDYDGAETGLRKAQVLCETAGMDAHLAKAWLVEAQVQKIRGNGARLKRIADGLESTFGATHRYWDDVEFMRLVTLQDQDPVQARRLAERLVRLSPEADHRWEVEWRLAWAAIESGDVDRALRHLEPLREQPGRRDREQARYWSARLREGRDREGSVDAYRELVRGASFYGLLARGRWRALDPEGAGAFESELRDIVAAGPANWEPSPRVRDLPEMAVVGRLRELGVPDGPGWVLKGLACRGGWSPGDALTLAQALYDTGEPVHAQRLIRRQQHRLLAGGVRSGNLHAWRMAYSLPFSEEIRKAAATEDLDPWLLQALVREESTFDADIVSWAGAVGLAQLMPPTAIGAYAAVYGGRLDLDRLTEPELNLRLGARVLKEGFERFRVAPLAVSNYNAGGGLTRRFLRKGAGDFDRFVESIGVDQTRGYVKRVLESWGRYRLLYGQALPDLPELLKKP